MRPINQPRIIKGRRLLDNILSVHVSGRSILDSLSDFNDQGLTAFYPAAVHQGSIGMQGKVSISHNRPHVFCTMVIAQRLMRGNRRIPTAGNDTIQRQYI